MLPVKCVSLSLHSLLVVVRPPLRCVVGLCYPGVALPAQPVLFWRNASPPISIPGRSDGNFQKKLLSCIIRVLDLDDVPLGEERVRHSILYSLSGFTKDLELPQPRHFLGILKSNPITVESSCEKDWFADADGLSAMHLLSHPRLLEDRRDGTFGAKIKGIVRSCSLMTLGSSVGFTGLEQRFTSSLNFTLKFLIVCVFFRFKQIRSFVGWKFSSNSVTLPRSL